MPTVADPIAINAFPAVPQANAPTTDLPANTLEDASATPPNAEPTSAPVTPNGKEPGKPQTAQPENASDDIRLASGDVSRTTAQTDMAARSFPPTATNNAAPPDGTVLTSADSVLAVGATKDVSKSSNLPGNKVAIATKDVKGETRAPGLSETTASHDDFATERPRETKNEEETADTASSGKGPMQNAGQSIPGADQNLSLAQTTAAQSHAIVSTPSVAQHAAVTAGAKEPAAVLPATAGSIPPDAAAPNLQSVRLVQTVGQSEMRVAFRSPDLGAVSIHTSATNDAIAARIAVDHGELAAMLTGQLPEMHARLGANHTVEVALTHAGSGSTSGNSEPAPQGHGSRSSGGGGNEGREAHRGRGSSYAASVRPVPDAVARAPVWAVGRLDVRV